MHIFLAANVVFHNCGVNCGLCVNQSASKSKSHHKYAHIVYYKQCS